MEDISARAKRILCEADMIAAEDTRMARKLLGLLGIKNKTVSNHKFNEKRQMDFLLAELAAGRHVALVSDAGTPCISDPGGLLVTEAAKRGIRVVGVGGVSAVTTALSVCGFEYSSFAFYGFFPKTKNEMINAVNILQKDSADAAVFFESPKRIKKLLMLLTAMLPSAKLCLCNDLTKMYERIYRGAPQEVLTELDNNPSAEKGEYTLVLKCDKQPPDIKDKPSEGMSKEALLVDYMMKNTCSLKEAVNELARRYKSKKEWYAASLRLKEMGEILLNP
jgi:16S rRNA (cytidine1402-2'-O)-methyltransferase